MVEPCRDEGMPSHDEVTRDAFVRRSSAILEAMANSSRLQVLDHLIEREVSVGDLCLQVGLSQSALSQHLAKLRTAGVVTTRRHAQTIYYTCSSAAVIQLLAMLTEFVPA